jgi:hypothetical protein
MMVCVTPFLHFNHMSAVCSTIPMYNSVFSFVSDDSFVRTKDSPKDPIRKSEDTRIRVFVLPLFPRYFIT